MAVLGWRVVRGLVKDARAGEAVVFKILGLVPAAETQRYLPTVTLANQMILVKISNGYHTFCQSFTGILVNPLVREVL